MALLDAYATLAEYRARVGDKGTGADTVIEEELLSNSRLLERSLQVAPGAFNTHTATYVFPARGGTLLRLRDSSGRAYFLRTVNEDGVGIDSGNAGTFDGFSLDLDDAWLRGLPENASLLSEPYTALELLGHLGQAAPRVWPDQSAAVQIAGTWGWATVPGLVKELVIHLAHELREAHLGGASLDLPAIDSSLPLSDQTWRYWREAKRRYGRRIPAVA